MSALIEQKVDALVIAPNDPETMAPLIAQAEAYLTAWAAQKLSTGTPFAASTTDFATTDEPRIVTKEPKR